MTAPIRKLLLILAIFLCLPQTGWGNWVYSDDPNGNGTQGYFGFKANVIESGGNYSASTAVLTSFSGPSTLQSIPPEVTIGITVNPGAPDEHPVTVTCAVRGFENFALASDAHWTSSVNIIGSFNLNGYDLTVNSPVKQQGDLNLGGRSFTVTGSGGWVQSGRLTIGTGGQLTVPGNFIHQYGALTLGGGHLLIGGDYLQGIDSDGDGTYERFCNGRIVMTNAADYMLVGGKAQFWSYYYTGGPILENLLSDGSLEIRGDFVQRVASDNWATVVDTFRATSSHHTLLSGTATQTVTFEGRQNNSFGHLEVTNTHPLVFGSPVAANRVTGVPLTIQSPDEGGISGMFETDVAYTTGGDFEILSSTSLGGHSLMLTLPAGGKVKQNGNLTIGTGGHLTVPGNYIHQLGELTLGGGRIEIGGDYLQGVDSDGDGTCETFCNYGRIVMTNAADFMKVHGKAQFWSDDYWRGRNILSDGILEIGGDFIQKIVNYSNATVLNTFRATGTHTLLSSATPQTVTFERPDVNFFSILEVTHPLANASIISVASGGNLKLNYAGINVIAALYLNGTLQPNGLYDSTNTNGLITGTGKIQVGPFADFTAWAAAIAPGQTADQDHDQDGVPNGIEYFIGVTGSGFTANPALINGTITWPKSADFTGSYAVEVSSDLMDWSAASAGVTDHGDSVEYAVPPGSPQCFVRLRVVPQ